MKLKAQYYIYVRCRPSGEPFYVGKGNTRTRRAQTLRRNRHHNNVLSKHGVRNCPCYIYYCTDEAQSFAYEIWMIAWCRAQGYRLTNMTNGGEGSTGFIHSEKARAKMSVTRKGMIPSNKGKPCSAELRAKLSIACSGFHHSAQTRAKMSNSHKGKSSGMKGKVSWNRGIPYSKEIRAKISASLRGKPLSAQTRAKLSTALKGNQNWLGSARIHKFEQET